MKKNNYLIYAIVFVAVIFLGYGYLNNGALNFWPGTSVLCLPGGHVNAASHIHPTMTITVDGIKENIPANIGVDLRCMAEIHTHDDTGTIHVETAKVGQTRNLEDFFNVWDRDIERDGYNVEVRINGEKFDDVMTRPLADEDKIFISYESR